MQQKFSAGTVRNSIQRFEDYSGDLLNSDMDSFDDRLSMLVDFCQSDEVFSAIHEQLISVRDVNFQQWYEEVKGTMGGMVGSGELRFPTKIEPRISLMYQLLVKVESKEIDFLDFCISFFVTDSNRISAYVRAFNEIVTAPLVRELTYRLENLIEELPADKKELVPVTSIQIIHSAQNVIQQNANGTNVTQTATQTLNSDLEGLFNQLAGEISKIDDKLKREESSEILESARDEARRDKPKTPVIAALLGALPAIGNIAELSKTIVELVSK